MERNKTCESNMENEMGNNTRRIETKKTRGNREKK